VRGGQRGGKKFLEFPAVTDQTKKAKTGDPITAQYLNKIIFRGSTVNLVKLGAGGLWRQVLPAFLPPRWPPLTVLCGIKGVKFRI
jgi:hypothetical protein